MNIQLFYLFVLVLRTVFSDNGSPCTTPNGENATCVPLSSCPVILTALLTGNNTASEFAKKSECGVDTQSLICCGSSAYPKPADSFEKLPNPINRINIKRGSPCTTPNGENVTCVPLSSCQVILTALLTGNDTASEFARQSECGYDTQTLICCGSSAYLLFADIFVKQSDRKNQTSKEELEAEILANFKTNELPDRAVCGLEKKDDRIVGGEMTHIDEHPWMVALEYKSKRDGSNQGIRCGGSIINNRYVLSAAHCLRHIEFKLMRAWLGEWKISTDPDCEKFIANTQCAGRVQKLKIKQTISHPFYSKRSRKNDIGLIRLETDIRYTDYIRPICMPPPDLPEPELGTLVTVAGWGITENSTESDVKLKVQVPLLSNDVCRLKLDNQSISMDHLCAGGEGGKDSCQGDSGGPLMRTYGDKLTQQNQWYQEGIVSWGIGCGIKEYPAVYIRTTRYMVWIINNIKDD